MNNAIANAKPVTVGETQIAKYLVHGDILFLKIFTDVKGDEYGYMENILISLIQFSEKKQFSSVAYLNI